MNIDPIFSDLDEEERSAISSLPRGDRLIELATLRKRPTREILSELSELAEITVIKDIELIDNPTATLPLRMIHEYQCIPIRTEGDATEKEKVPIALATVWPPDELMDRWVYAVSGRKVQWFMGDPEQITETITQNFGVGAGSLDESDLINDVAEAEEVEDEDEDDVSAAGGEGGGGVDADSDSDSDGGDGAAVQKDDRPPPLGKIKTVLKVSRAATTDRQIAQTLNGNKAIAE